ncbi:hypothetical protein AB0K60_35465 [Thermopolyspora sp. NPDC052614]|uniref:hypothetical protein n=1 Tax=Thermopolyspora sp. NPDC052614 TaxID=3155682 RepID=UPI0034357A89
MAENGNSALKRAREELNLSQEAVVERLAELGRQMYEMRQFRRPMSIGIRQYARWESDSPPWPYADNRRLLEEFFGKPITELGFKPPRQRTSRPELEPSENVILDRRELIVEAGLPWLLSSGSPLEKGERELKVGEDEVGLLLSIARDLDEIDQQFGGDRLWRSATIHLKWVHYLIEQGTYPPSIASDLHAIAGQLTTSLGWYCYDANQQSQARVYFSEALNTAMLNNDDMLATRTLANMSRQSVDLGKPREAIRFAQIAQAHARKWATPRVTALLAIREAQGHARNGDDISCRNAARTARQAFERGPDERDPHWVAFLIEPELTTLEGMCMLDLGQHGSAVPLLEEAARQQPAKYSRNRGIALSRLAHAVLAHGDLDRAIDITQNCLSLIASGVSSARVKNHLAIVRGGLEPYKNNNSRVRDITEQVGLAIA